MKAGGGGHPVLGATERVCCNSIITFGALFGSALGGPVSDALGKKIGMFAVCTRLAVLQASRVAGLVLLDCMLAFHVCGKHKASRAFAGMGLCMPVAACLRSACTRRATLAPKRPTSYAPWRLNPVSWHLNPVTFQRLSWSPCDLSTPVNT